MTAREFILAAKGWIDDEGTRVDVIAVDEPPYPVLFRWKGYEGDGRDTIEGFLRDHTLTGEEAFSALREGAKRRGKGKAQGPNPSPGTAKGEL